VLALVLVGGLVAGILLATQSHRNRPPAATSPPPPHTASVLRISSVNVFMFSAANPPDDPPDTPFTFDGKPTTSWHTDQYKSSTFSNLYPGIGLIIRLSAGATLHTLSVTSPTSGWAARTYVSSTALATGQPLSAWGSPTDTKSSISGNTTFSLAGHHGQYVLLWLTNLGPAPYQVRIAELGVS
jgi:putative peptidoglycan lipid II flippase